MADRPLKLSELRRCLRRFDVTEDTARGKGAHTMFFRVVDGLRMSYPVPRHGKDVKQCYVSGCRKKFKLREQDGITDEMFYG